MRYWWLDKEVREVQEELAAEREARQALKIARVVRVHRRKIKREVMDISVINPPRRVVSQGLFE